MTWNESLIWIPAVVISLPLLFGRGVDLPDDALYSSLSTWEWLETAWREGLNPFWVPGRLGGQSLYAEAIQMAPLYPAALLLTFLPARVAWPLACLLHGVLASLTTAALARRIGLGRLGATTAAWGVTLGTLGVTATIEAQTDTWPIITWFPAVLASWEGVVRASDPRSRRRSAALGALALGLMLLGAHVRHGAGACGALMLWPLLRSPRLWPWALGMGGIGVLLGAPAWLPAMLEWGQAVTPDSWMPAMAVPPEQTLRWTAATSMLVPRVFVTAREFSPGTLVLLGVAWSFALPGPIRRLGIYASVLLVAAAGPRLPGGWPILLPLSWLAHPVNILYAGLAMVPLSVLGAAGLERMVLGAKPSRWGVGLISAIGVLTLLRLGFAPATWISRYQWDHALLGALQAGLLTTALLTVVMRTLPRPSVVAALVLFDLALYALHAHLAVSSRPLPMAERATFDAEPLRAGSADLTDLSRLDPEGLHWVPHLQSSGAPAPDGGGEATRIEMEGPELQNALLDRRWPVHLATARGFPGLSDRVKLPAQRELALLRPLVEELHRLSESSLGLDSGDSGALFADPASLGTRTLALHGIRTLLTPTGARDLGAAVPLCRTWGSWSVEADSALRIARLLYGPPGPPLLEGPLQMPAPTTVGQASCPHGPTEVQVETKASTLLILRLRSHPGWRFNLDGEPVSTFPADQIQTGIVVPLGTHALRGRFVPPGLPLALGLAAAAAWGILLGLGPRSSSAGQRGSS